MYAELRINLRAGGQALRDSKEELSFLRECRRRGIHSRGIQPRADG